MGVILVVLTALVLNMAGAVVAKWIAVDMDSGLLAVSLLGLLIFICSLRIIFWIAVGRRWQLSFIYPVLSINYLFAFLLGIRLFGEQFLPSRLLGAFVIVGGVLIVSLSENKHEKRAA